MVTAMADRETVLKAVEYGGDGYIIKPICKSEFKAKIKSLGLI